MSKLKNCPVCTSSETAEYVDLDLRICFYSCPVCGRFELDYFDQIGVFNPNHLTAYLIHNRFEQDDKKCRYHTIRAKEICDMYRIEYDKGHNTHGRPVHMNNDVVENWYPKTFNEKVDAVLLFLNSQIHHMGQIISIKREELISACFIDRYEKDDVSHTWVFRGDPTCDSELRYIFNYLTEQSYVTLESTYINSDALISILPEGYARIDALQKNTSYGRNALVAMKFGDDTKELREAIRQGIKDAGYIAVFIDEVQHNDFITPELLKYIRDSKFVVVDLTHQNNGAYFEEGYAMGLGKPVIQLCQKDTKLHFDIAQKNTIMWGVEGDIPLMLANRIKATVD